MSTHLLPDVKTPHLKITSPLGITVFTGRAFARYFFTGNPIFGGPRDNATFLHAATVDYRRGPKEKLSAARWRRVVRRQLLGLLPLAIVAVFGEIGLLLYTASIVVGAAALVARRVQGYRVHKRNVMPAYEVARTLLPDLPAGRRAAREHLKLVPGLTRRWRLTIPNTHMDAQRKQKIVLQVGRKLGLTAPCLLKESWEGKAWIVIGNASVPPLAVEWATARPFMEATDGRNLFVGLAPGDEAIFVDLDADSPHLAISGGSRNGKSVHAGILACQVLRKGGVVVVLDFKMISQRGLKGMPGVYYADTAESIHEALLALRAESQRRARMVRDGRDPGVPILVLAEEMNACDILLRDYWSNIKEQGQPNASPAWKAWTVLCCTSAAFRMNIISVTQDPQHKAFGDASARSNFGAALLGRPRAGHWDKITEIKPKDRPRSHKHTGRYHLVVGDEVTTYQVPFLDPGNRSASVAAEHGEWMREFIYSGTTPPNVHEMLGVERPEWDGEVIGVGQAGAERSAECGGAERLVALNQETAEALPGAPLALSTLRQLKRHSGFPAPVGVTKQGVPAKYRWSELVQWKSARDGGQAEILGELRSGIVYGFKTLVVDASGQPCGGVELGYVGQTRRGLHDRGDEHRGRGEYPREQPWSDLIVGDSYVIWEGQADDVDLDQRELDAIIDLKPRYNWLGQEGQAHVTPPDLARQQRAQRAAGAS